MKKEYIKPECEVVEMDSNTPLMADSVTTGFNPTPSEPDAIARRGEWGNLWADGSTSTIWRTRRR